MNVTTVSKNRAVKVKFHYAVDSHTRLTGRRPTRTELVEIARTCLRPAFDPKKGASWSQTRTNWRA